MHTAASALQYIHSRSNTHMDVKPANYCRRTSDSFSLVLIDFEAAQSLPDEPYSGCKPSSMFVWSPEARCGSYYPFCQDMYAAGCCMRDMLAHSSCTMQQSRALRAMQQLKSIDFERPRPWLLRGAYNVPQPNSRVGCRVKQAEALPSSGSRSRVASTPFFLDCAHRPRIAALLLVFYSLEYGRNGICKMRWSASVLLAFVVSHLSAAL